MRRRAFLAGISASWLSPGGASGQGRDRPRRIGALMNFREQDQEAHARIAAFLNALQKLGWSAGDNLLVEIRWSGDDPDLSRKYAEELVKTNPEVIMASASPNAAALKRLTQSIPIIFVNLIDPIGSGMVASMAHPGGNLTGFTAFEYNLAGKWLELLKEFAPGVTEVTVIEDPSYASGIGQFAAIQAFGASSNLDFRVIDPRDRSAIAADMSALAGRPHVGIIVTGSTSAGAQRDLIIALALQYRVATIYSFPFFAQSGGLVAYGPDTIEGYSRAAEYIDRVLRGARPQDLPVQAPNHYKLVVNMRTAKAIGLDVPPAVLARADEIIE